MRRVPRFVAWTLVIAVVLAVYVPVLHVDLGYAAGEPHVDPGLVKPSWSEFRPLYGLVYRLEAQGYRFFPQPLVLGSVLLHALACLSAGAWARQLARDDVAGLLTALLVAVHPASASSVLLVPEQPYIVANILAFASLRAFLATHEAPLGSSAAYVTGGVWSSLVVTVGPVVGPLLLLGALLAHVDAIAALAVIALTPGRAPRPGVTVATGPRAWARRVAPYAIAVLAYVVLRLAFGGDAPAPERTAAIGSASAPLATRVRLAFLLLPRMAFMLLHPDLPKTLMDLPHAAEIWVALAVALLMVAGTVFVRRRRELVMPALAVLAALAVAQVELVRMGPASPYVAYPGVAAILAVAWAYGIRVMSPFLSATLVVAATVIIVTFGIETAQALEKVAASIAG